MVWVAEVLPHLPDVSHALLDAPLQVHVVEAAEAGAGRLPLHGRLGLATVRVGASLPEHGTLARPRTILAREQPRLLG